MQENIFESDEIFPDKYDIENIEEDIENDYYGDERLWWVISSANPDITRRDSFFIKSGVQVRIPDINRIQQIKQQYDSLNAAR